MGTKIDRRALAGIAIPSFFALLYCLPIIGLGADNLSMIEYFDQDEYVLVEFGTRFYQHGILPTEPACGYPKLFNYLCGLFLYPYALIFGADAQVVAITFRLANVIAMVLTIAAINLIAIRFFRSYLVGFVGSLLFALTPEFLWWGTNSRPHPLEICFIAMAIYFCLSALDTRRMRPLWASVFCAGLATGTKLGGIFFVPTIVLVYAYLLWTERSGNAHLKPEGAPAKAVAAAVFGLGCAALYLVYYTLFVVVRRSTGITVAQEIGWQQGMLSWPFSLGIGMGLMLMTLAVLLLLLNRKAIRIYGNVHRIADRRIGGKTRPVAYLFADKIAFFSAKASLALLATFLLTNFDFLIFPRQNAFSILNMFFLTVQGTDLQQESSFLLRFKWFEYFPAARGMGITGTLIAAVYFLTEILQRRSGAPEKQARVQRLMLLSYPLVLLGFLIAGVEHRGGHYLLPAFLILFLLGADAMVRMARRIGKAHRRRIYQAICTAAILLCILERLPHLLELRTLLAARSQDPAVTQFEPWISTAYSDGARIMSDDVSMYIPDTFTEVSYWRGAWRRWGRLPGIEDGAYRTLSEERPNLFIRSNLGRIDTTWAEYGADIAYLRENYSVVKRIPCRTKARVSYPRNEIVVYERNR